MGLSLLSFLWSLLLLGEFLGVWAMFGHPQVTASSEIVAICLLIAYTVWLAYVLARWAHFRLWPKVAPGFGATILLIHSGCVLVALVQGLAIAGPEASASFDNILRVFDVTDFPVGCLAYPVVRYLANAYCIEYAHIFLAQAVFLLLFGGLQWFCVGCVVGRLCRAYRRSSGTQSSRL